MKIFPVLLNGLVLASLVLASGCAGTPAVVADRTSIPRIASIGDVQIGYSTQEELEQVWGEGLTVVGGHPNSGRRWRVRDTDWVIATDGFVYSERGLVIDSLQIVSQAESRSRRAPFAKLDKKEFAWLGEISRGMSRLEVMAALNRQNVKFKEEGEFVRVEGGGFSEITSEAGADIRYWEADLFFEEGKLSSLQIDADPAKR